MFVAKQEIIDVDGTLLGGELGALPTVLIGSIFYKRHSIVTDESKGEFNRSAAVELLRKEERLSEETGNPRILDVVAETAEAMCRYLDFILEQTQVPFLVDSPLARVRMEAMRYLAKHGGMERAVYNSIDPNSSQEELEVLGECGVKHVLILAFSTTHLKPRDRVRLLLDDEESGEKGLIGKVKEMGVANILIDPGVLDLPSNSWTAEAIHLIKEQLGLPAGCAPSNALYSWLRCKNIASPTLQACGASVLSMPVYKGADFLLYGPLQNAEWVYPAISIADAMNAYLGRVEGSWPLTKDHCLYKVV